MTELAAIKGRTYATMVQQFAHAKDQVSVLKTDGISEKHLNTVIDILSNVMGASTALMELDPVQLRKDSDKLILLACGDVKERRYQ